MHRLPLTVEEEAVRWASKVIWSTLRMMLPAAVCFWHWISAHNRMYRRLHRPGSYEEGVKYPSPNLVGNVVRRKVLWAVKVGA